MDVQCGASKSTTDNPLAAHNASASGDAMTSTRGDQRCATHFRTGVDIVHLAARFTAAASTSAPCYATRYILGAVHTNILGSPRATGPVQNPVTGHGSGTLPRSLSPLYSPLFQPQSERAVRISAESPLYGVSGSR